MTKVLIISLLFIPALKADPILVEVIDTGVDLSHKEINKHISFVRNLEFSNYNDSNSHGTHITGLVLKDVCDRVELISCKYFDVDSIIMCIQRGIDLKVQFINFSSIGNFPYSDEHIIFEKAVKSGIKVSVAAGNNNADLKEYPLYPASYNIPGLIVVGNVKNYKGEKAFTSNYGLKNMVWEIGENVLSTIPNGKFGYMSGTSQATAIHTNRLIRSKCNESERKIKGN